MKGRGLKLAAVTLVVIAANVTIARGAVESIGGSKRGLDGSIVTNFQPFAVADGTQDSGVVACGGDSQVVGTAFGGTDTSGDHLLLNSIQLFSPSEDQVEIWADNLGGGSPSLNAEVQIICDTNAGRGEYRMRRTKVVGVKDGRARSATARCRGDESVVGGAVLNSGAFGDDAWLSSSGPVDLDDPGKTPDDGWRGMVINRGGGADDRVGMSAIAMCDTKHNNVGYRSKTTRIDNGDLGGASVKCKGNGSTLLGGGVLSHSSYRHALYITDVYKEGETFETGVLNDLTPDDKRREITSTAICLG